MPPQFGMPHAFWGTVKNQKGNNLPDGTIVKAVVDNETFYTTVMNGMYGWNETYQESNPPFYIEDVDFDNNGNIILFHVGGINTEQTEVFLNGCETHLDLTIDDGSQSDIGNGYTPGVGNGDNTAEQNPVANAGGPYFGSINRKIIFDASGSTDDGTIVSYSWDFGDQKTGEGVETNHIYNIVGNYTVILTVTDDEELVDNDTTKVYIYDDTDGDGWTDEEEERYKTDSNDSSDYPLDYDGDYIPNIIDLDDDNDGLSDSIENKIGSNPLNENDVLQVLYKDIIYFFVDNTSDLIPDFYYNINNGLITDLEQTNEEGVFYVDADGDSTTWEFVYKYSKGELLEYSSNSDNVDEDSSILILVTIIIIILIIIGLLFYKRLGGKK